MRPLSTWFAIAALLAAAGCASTPAPPKSGSGSGTDAGAAAGAGAQGAAQPATGTPPPGNSGAATGGGSAEVGGAVGSGTVQTADERRAAIDQQLTASLGAFDTQLRQEQQETAQERDARQSAAAADAAAKEKEKEGSAATEGPPGENERKDERPGSKRRHDPSGDLKSEKASKKPDDNAGNGAVAREIPDGSDDDVVARRLRQAAEQETDPELKQKLWQEYLDYKKNAQGK